MATPRVSVIMAAYNAEPHLREAVESILAQTFHDFEFIVIDDASSDATAAILDSYGDARIVRLRNDHNTGLTRSLNSGLAAARGEYIARMDADDVSLPRRLEQQVAYLDAHPQVGLVASAFAFIDESGIVKQVFAPPTTPAELRAALLAENQICHGSVMYRRSCVEALGGYRHVFRYAQDYDLWLRLVERCEVASINEVLYHYRITQQGISVAKVAEQDAYTALAKAWARQRLMGLPEDLSLPARLLERRHRTPGLRAWIRGRRAMAGYHVNWGKALLASYQVRSARQELLTALRQFPLEIRAWLYLGASLLGVRALRCGRTLLKSCRESHRHPNDVTPQASGEHDDP